MNEIPLSAYIQEIDLMIEDGRASEAVDHCLHILKSYPWHSDTYRLLGTAYLEEHRYNEARDIFLRLLCVIPEDMVAHLGISVIEEYNNQIDPAIYHMERAYELQPANPVLQNELKRLYGLRDGIEPSRVLLTTGALARMYYKGDLYPQTIAELEAITKKQTDRLDMLVLLAHVYEKVGRKGDAVTTSRMILNRLPNCLEANRILAMKAMDEGVEDNDNQFLETVKKINPDFSLGRNGSTPEIPGSQMAAIERLERNADYPESQYQESIITTIGTGNTQQIEGEVLPEWIEDIERDLDGAIEDHDTEEIETSLPEEPGISDEDTKPNPIW